MPWLTWFVFLGPGALVVAAVLVAALPPGRSWLVWQAVAGVFAIVLAWQVGDWAGAFDDQDPEGCSDCGELAAFASVAMVASCVGWVVGTALGGAVRRVRRG